MKHKFEIGDKVKVFLREHHGDFYIRAIHQESYFLTNDTDFSYWHSVNQLILIHPKRSLFEKFYDEEQ